MAAITEQLEKSIKDLSDALEMESPTWKSIAENMLPDREVAKRILMSMGFTELEAHALCYGHTDLESTEVKKDAMDNNSEMLKGVRNMKDDVKRAVNKLYKESVRMGKAVASLTAETAMATAAIANALATVPPQPAVATYTAEQYNERVSETIASFSSIDTELGALGNIALIVSEAMLTILLTPVIALIDTLTLGISTLKLIPTISGE